jgi:hypothetical protein
MPAFVHGQRGIGEDILPLSSGQALLLRYRDLFEAQWPPVCFFFRFGGNKAVIELKGNRDDYAYAEADSEEKTVGWVGDQKNSDHG